MAWPVGLRSDPLFSRAVNYGAPCPINFRPFLAPNAHRKPCHCSPPVLRLAADLATPLARSRSNSNNRWQVGALAFYRRSDEEALQRGGFARRDSARRFFLVAPFPFNFQELAAQHSRHKTQVA
jgi:hypothetical protein